MASKSKDVRLEQLRIFEKKLALRLQQLEQKGIAKEKAQTDPLVKSLKSKIRETNVRIKAFDKFVQKNEDLAKAKEQKLADLAKKEEEPEAKEEEPKPKKKAAAEKESKKAAKESAKPVEGEEAAPKKAKKQADAAEGAEPKKKATKKKEE
jgi:DNA topoisomerase-1